MPLDPALYWLIMGVMLLALALVLPGFVLFFFAVGALATALVAWLVPMTSIVLQLVLFLVASLATLLSLKGIMEKRILASAANSEGEEGEK